MKRTPWVVIGVALPLIVVVAVVIASLAARDDDAGPGQIEVSSAPGAVEYEHDYLIPAGTADRIAAGEEIEIVPQELVVKVGEAIRIVNDDDVDHIVGVFFVAAGEQLTQRFNTAGVLEGQCSVHPSGSFTLRVVEA